MIEIVKKFKPLVRKGFRPRKFLSHIFYVCMTPNKRCVVCANALRELVCVEPSDVLDLHFTDKPLSVNSVPITLIRCEFDWSWRWKKGHVTNRWSWGYFYPKTGDLIHKHFGEEPQVVHGWLTVY